jgi:hypothetical protein
MATRRRRTPTYRRATMPYTVCPGCGHGLIFRPWFTDRNGVKHYARAYGWRAFRFCPVCRARR